MLAMSRLTAIFVWLAVSVLGAVAQNSAPTNAELPVIKTSTRLVQVSVVVTDKHGVPIKGLKKEDFTLLDAGRPQEITIFSTESLADRPAQTLPPNVFTNRADLGGTGRAPTAVILMDALNTSPQDQLFARDQLVKALKAMPPETHVAIYVLGSSLQVLHDFTGNDATLLKVMSESTAINPAAVDPMRARNAPDRDQMRTEYAETRLIPLAASIIAIANRMAEIPGRKELIWITGGVRLSLSSQFKIKLQSIGYLGSSPQYAESGYDLFTAASEALNAANVAFYGIDVHGVQMNSGGAGGGGTPGNPRGAMRRAQGQLDAEQSSRDTYRMLADRTGGLAFYGNNGVAEAVVRACNDEDDSYILGYYPNHGKWNGSFRKLTVKAKVPGAIARYRDGYYANSGEQSKLLAQVQLQQAIDSPVDYDLLSLTVSGRATEPPQPGVLEFQVGVNLAQLMLDHENGDWKGAIDLIFVQRDANGKMLATDSKRLELDLPDAKHDELLKTGSVFERHLAIAQGAEDVRVIVRDPASSAYGTVTVPMKTFFASADSGR
jgi:VWFA-related protein